MIPATEIIKELKVMDELIQKHGSNPEAEGMYHALTWVLYNIVPTPANYTRMLYGLQENDDAANLSITGTVGIRENVNRSTDSAEEAGDPNRCGPESELDSDVGTRDKERRPDSP